VLKHSETVKKFTAERWGVGVFASCYRGSNCSLARAMDDRISAAAPFTLVDQLQRLRCGWSGIPVGCAIQGSLALALALYTVRHSVMCVCVRVRVCVFSGGRHDTVSTPS